MDPGAWAVANCVFHLYSKFHCIANTAFTMTESNAFNGTFETLAPP